MKLIFLIVGLAMGFGGGAWYGVHHPEDASKLAALEEAKLLELKIQATEAVKAKLDQKIADSKKPAGGVGFLSGKSAGPDPSLVQVRDDEERELQQMKSQLSQIKKK